MITLCYRQVDFLDWDNLLEVNMSLSKLFVVPDTQVRTHDGFIQRLDLLQYRLPCNLPSANSIQPKQSARNSHAFFFSFFPVCYLPISSEARQWTAINLIGYFNGSIKAYRKLVWFEISKILAIPLADYISLDAYGPIWCIKDLNF